MATVFEHQEINMFINLNNIIVFSFEEGTLCKLFQTQPLCQVTQAMVDECCEARRGLETACEPLKGKKAKKA